MIEMQKLSPKFEAVNPDIKVNRVVLDDATLRSRVTTAISTKGGQFDVMTIGMYEASIWGKPNWFQALKFNADYKVDYILPAMRDGKLEMVEKLGVYTVVHTSADDTPLIASFD